MYEDDRVFKIGLQEELDRDESDSDEKDGTVEVLLLSEPDLVQKLFDEVAQLELVSKSPTKPPDLAMRWQPPHDFTPPKEDFDTGDVDLLPVRQEPVFGGDLFTPGWARGAGRHMEGFCARCPVSHWVNIFDGSYRFHLTYFHGVADSGVPLPRPSTIRPVQGTGNLWEGFCEACRKWKTLKKTKRGWNWYRHWLTDHLDIVNNRMEALGPGKQNTREMEQMNLAEPSDLMGLSKSDIEDIPSLEEALSSAPNNDDIAKSHLEVFARDDLPESIEALLERLRATHNDEDLRALANHRDKSGESLLMISALHGQDRVVKLLLDSGANPNAVAQDGQTALDRAADAGNFRVAQQLINRGADASKSHTFKRIFSNEREYAGEMTKAVIDTVQPQSKINTAQLGPLSQAASNGDSEIVKRLLSGNDAGYSEKDIEEGAEAGHTPFLLASMAGHLQVMALLLENGANINATSKHGWTALMLASKKADEKCVTFLIPHGADVNHLSPDRWTALAEATQHGHTRIMRALLHAGADPQPRSQHDWTPLMHAAYRGDLAAVNLLLDAGASFDEISSRDETVMLLAAAKGSTAVVRRLLDAGCPPESVWSARMRGLEADDVSTTIEESAEDDAAAGLAPGMSVPDSRRPQQQQQRIERAYKVGWTPLMVACQIGSLEIVRLLLDAGANAEPRSPMFKTALEIAKENARVDVAQYLEQRFTS